MMIIAHRGASGYAPENTIASLGAAIKIGCDGIEIDVQLTKDEQVVVCHDWTVDRTTGGTGAIKDLTLEEIRKLEAGSWFSEDFRGEKIPTLEEVLEFLPNSMLLNVEIKSKILDNRGIEKKVVELLEKHGRIENTIISSFNHLCLRRVKDLSPELKIAVLYEAHLLGVNDYLKQNNLPIYSCHPNNYYTDSQMIEELHNNDIKVYTWTVNEAEQARKLIEMGVDGIITNYPDMLR